MAGSKVSDYSIGDSNIQSVMLTLDKAYKGLHQVSLTNYDSTSESQIAAGSVVECNGAQYKFDSNESITGSPSDGTVYIRLVPAGDTITAEYTNTAPTWSDSKQGWYGTGGDANKRYLEFALIKDSALWNKYNDENRFFKRDKKARMAYSLTPGGQSITGSGAVAYGTLIFDEDSNYLSNKFIVKKSGYYYINAMAMISRNGTYIVQLSIYVNSARAVIGNGFGASDPITGVQRYCVVNGLLFLETGDEVEIYVRQGSPSQLVTITSADSNFSIFSVYEV